MTMKMNIYTVDSFNVWFFFHIFFGLEVLYCWPHWMLVCKGQSNNIYFTKRQYIIVIDRFHSKHWKYSTTLFEYLGSMLCMSDKFWPNFFSMTIYFSMFKLNSFKITMCYWLKMSYTLKFMLIFMVHWLRFWYMVSFS